MSGYNINVDKCTILFPAEDLANDGTAMATVRVTVFSNISAFNVQNFINNIHVVKNTKNIKRFTNTLTLGNYTVTLPFGSGIHPIVKYSNITYTNSAGRIKYKSYIAKFEMVSGIYITFQVVVNEFSAPKHMEQSTLISNYKSSQDFDQVKPVVVDGMEGVLCIKDYPERYTKYQVTYPAEDLANDGTAKADVGFAIIPADFSVVQTIMNGIHVTRNN